MLFKTFRDVSLVETDVIETSFVFPNISAVYHIMIPESTHRFMFRQQIGQLTVNSKSITIITINNSPSITETQNTNCCFRQALALKIPTHRDEKHPLPQAITHKTRPTQLDIHPYYRE